MDSYAPIHRKYVVHLCCTLSVSHLSPAKMEMLTRHASLSLLCVAYLLAQICIYREPGAESSAAAGGGDAALEAAAAPAPPSDAELFPFVPGKSLDRSRFNPKHLVHSLKNEWNSSQAENPLVIPLPDFG